ILRELPLFVDPVGVFVNDSIKAIYALLTPLQQQLGRMRTLQCHGEKPEVVDCHPFQRIVAFAVSDAVHLNEATRYLEVCRGAGRSPAAILIDARVRGQFGGTGKTAPWNLLADFRPGVPLILAGGLTPENVAEAIRVVRPYAVDVASGVESAPGVKDPDKVRRFIEAARAAV